ncbi:MAG: fibronectin type III-like domain-contianing protein [Clostridiales bacterium]|nr:fibronectin type III-like domain-contianing protein [Clostridiales bacterium]
MLPDRIDSRDSADIYIDVTNTGNMDGDEVIQMYITDDISHVTRPVKELKGFEKVYIKKGETKTVKFVVTPGELGFLDKDMNFIVEKGQFTVMVGGNQKDVLMGKLEII